MNASRPTDARTFLLLDRTGRPARASGGQVRRFREVTEGAQPTAFQQEVARRKALGAQVDPRSGDSVTLTGGRPAPETGVYSRPRPARPEPADPPAPPPTASVEVAPVDTAPVEPVEGQDAAEASQEAEAESAERSEEASPKGSDGETLSQEEVEELDRLKARDREVKTHEQAHKSVGGKYAGQISYEWERGPDGNRYAVGGSVPIDVGPVQGDPEATIEKMRVVQRAALAPAEPSDADRKVAAQASQTESQARAELTNKRAEETRGEGERKPGEIEEASGSVSGEASGHTADAAAALSQTTNASATAASSTAASNSAASNSAASNSAASSTSASSAGRSTRSGGASSAHQTASAGKAASPAAQRKVLGYGQFNAAGARAYGGARAQGGGLSLVA